MDEGGVQIKLRLFDSDSQYWLQSLPYLKLHSEDQGLDSLRYSHKDTQKKNTREDIRKKIAQTFKTVTGIILHFHFMLA